jgi:prevent-host-death family protein
MTSPRRTIPAARFKARCLALLDEVGEKQETLVVTKRGRPVAMVVPVSGEARPRSLKGSVRILGDVMAPIGEPWDADR